MRVLRRILAYMVLVLSVVGCGKQDPLTPLRIGTSVWPGFEPLYLARDLGYLDPKSVHLVEYPASSETIRAFRNHAIDGAAVTLDEVLLLAQDGFEPRVVLVLDYSHGGDAIVGREYMRTVKDLIGRRVAVESGGVGAYVFKRALMLNGLSASDIEVVYLPVNEHAAAFKQGKVDASVCYEPMRSELLAAGASLLFDSTQIPEEIVDVLVVQHPALEKKLEGVRELLGGWFRAIDYLDQQPHDAAARMARREQVTVEQFLKSLEGLQILGRSDNLRLLNGQDPPLMKSAERLMQFMLEQKLLQTAADIDKVIATAPLASLPP